MVCCPDIPKDTFGDFRSQQAFHHATRLSAAGGTVVPCRFICIGLIVNTAVVYAVVKNTIAIGCLVRLVTAQLIVDRWSLHPLCGIYNMFTHSRIITFILPIPRLFIKHGSQVQQPLTLLRVGRVIYLVVEPKDTFKVISSTCIAPITKRTVWQFFFLIPIILFKKWEHSFIRIPLLYCGLIVVTHPHQSRHARPPIF